MTDKQPKPTYQEAADAIAYFRSTTNRHDLTDLLTAFIGPAPEKEKEPEHKEKVHVPAASTGKLGLRK